VNEEKVPLARLGRNGLTAMLAAVLCGAAGCEWMDPVVDSPVFEREVRETAAQRRARECREESERYEVSCAFCHVAEASERGMGAQSALTERGQRAKIMRESEFLGRNRSCGACHASHFRLNAEAERRFGPGGRPADAPKSSGK